jgi:glycosyltransferase involved in cell wall biosynthesis
MSSGAAKPPPDFQRRSGRAPQLTVGIPTYDRPHLLRETLRSLEAQHGGSAFEVVICDDGGRPETRAAIEASALPDVRYYVNRPSLGAIGNWNRCIELAAAPWVTILHEDDAVYPWFIATVAPHLGVGTAAVAIRCVQGERFEPRVEVNPPPPPRDYPALWFIKSSMTPFPGVVFPRELALRLGGFDRAQGGTADHAFWYALAHAGRFVVVRHVAAFYRITPGQWTERAWPEMLRSLHVLRLRIAREQFPAAPRLGRWLARFYTARSARAYARRFAERPLTLVRARRFEGIPGAWLPSGWVWAFLRLLPRLRRK